MLSVHKELYVRATMNIMTFQQYATAVFKLEHFHFGNKQPDICWFCLSEVYMKMKFHRSLHRLVRLVLIMWRLLACVLMASVLQARDLRTRQTTCPNVCDLSRCSSALKSCYFGVVKDRCDCCTVCAAGGGGVLWESRICSLRSGNDLWISQRRARHACVWIPRASVRQRWENISQCLPTESGEQTGWEERHTCCHFHPDRPLRDRWGKKNCLFWCS